MNQRPSGYEPDELPDCSTPRRCHPAYHAGNQADEGGVVGVPDVVGVPGTVVGVVVVLPEGGPPANAWAALMSA